MTHDLPLRGATRRGNPGAMDRHAALAMTLLSNQIGIIPASNGHSQLLINE
jgi:hypothetical protein